MDSFIKWWLNNQEQWFNSTPENDNYISNRFGYLLYTLPSFDLSEYDQFGWILIFDQLSRHVWRHFPNEVKVYHGMALVLAERLLENNHLSIDKNIFILLTLRHTFKIEYIDRAISIATNLWLQSRNRILLRFIKSSIYSKLQLENVDTFKVNYENIGAFDGTNDIFDDRSVKTICPKSICKNNLLDKTSIKYPKNNIIVSLSGGVDSMCLLYCLTLQYKPFNIIAVHINYNNRASCNDEVVFLSNWCKHLGITLYVRTITEVKRIDYKETERNFYEKVTKTIRYSIYQNLGLPVFIGHNKDDCIENILTNIRNNTNMDELTGMKMIKTIDNIIQIRPFLNVSKKDIYAFADKYAIPFFKTSTPEWSTRGKIRDIIVPALEKVFDDSISDSLLQFSANYNQIYEIFNDYIDSFIQQNFKNNTLFITNDIREKGFVFWKQVFMKLGYFNLSNRSIKSFSFRIKNKQFGRIFLNKQMSVVYTHYYIMLE